MKADRLLSELLMLQAYGQLTGREIAERLEVSERTVHRDMESLSAAKVPVFALRGAQGGWKLDDGWRTQVPGLDEAELRALLMAQPRVIGDRKLAAAAERALGKLMAALPDSLREQAASIRQRLHVDTTAWRGSTESPVMLPIVQDAVARDRKLSMRYKPSGREAAERIVDPLGLVAKGSSWYLVANTPKGLRTFRVSRIQEVRVLEQACERPTGFDLAEYWESSTKQFQEGWRTHMATLRLEPRSAEWIKMWQLAAEIQPNETPDAEGWITLVVRFNHEDEARFVVLGLGANVEVIEPASLRDRVLAEQTAVFERRGKAFLKRVRGES
ncbi:MAG: YafY family transcriptional regulator [Acidobacteria bacterium]|nr:YafY family transcriptional regulator [Acidobacteriota bacterium]